MNRIQAIKKLLLVDWDPIGISDEPHAQDEYDMYVPGIVEILSRGGNQQQLADYLLWIVTERMSLGGNRQHNQQIAVRLLRIWDAESGEDKT